MAPAFGGPSALRTLRLEEMLMFVAKFISLQTHKFRQTWHIQKQKAQLKIPEIQ